MKEKYGAAIAEVLDILEHTNKKSVDKISKSFIQFLKNNVDEDYKVNIDYSIPLEEAQLQEETLAIIAMISYSYWCNDEEKKELLKKLKQNDIKQEVTNIEKHDFDDLFKKGLNKENNNKEEIIKNEIALIKKENLLTKIINKFKKNFKKED